MKMKDWTVMVYMAGDNNLAVDMAYAMEQIKSAAGQSENSPNLFVYYDGSSADIPTLYCDFSDPNRPRYVRSYKVEDKPFPVAAKVNENAADPKSILNFVDWCLNKAPVENDSEVTFGRRAKKYALIFSGHSLGFQDIGLFRDESSGKTLKMSDLKSVITRLTATRDELMQSSHFSDRKDASMFSNRTLLIGQKLDILGFDSCVMGMLEVGFQFRERAKVMIASEGSVPSAGWTYAKILGELAGSDPASSTPELVAQRFVRDFIKSQDAYTIGGVSVDMAAWDLTRLRDLAVSLDELSAALLDCLSEPESKLYKFLARGLLQAHWHAQSYMYDQNVDLADFCELLQQECSLYSANLDDTDAARLAAVSEQCQNVISQLKNVVLLSGFSGGAYQYSNGVAVFFPWSLDAYEVSRKNYESLWIVKDAIKRSSNWNAFLRKYLSETALRKFTPPSTVSESNGRYRYFAGIQFDDERRFAHESQAVTKIAGQEGSKIAGQEGSKIAGQEGSKIAGQEGSKIAGQEGSKIAGQEGSKIAGQEGSKIAGQEGSKIAGQEGSKIAGQEGSKIAGQEGSKIAGQEGSKIARQEGSKIAGQEGSKIAGQEGSKIAGQEGSKIAGQEGSKIAGQEGSKLAGSGASTFFNSLRLFKNIESPWNISGFSRLPDEEKAKPAKQVD